MSENPYQSPREPPPPENSPRDDEQADVNSFSLGLLWFGVDVALIFVLMTIDPFLIFEPLVMLFLAFGMPALMVAIMVGVRGKSRSPSSLGFFFMLAFATALGLANAWFIMQCSAAV